MLNNKFLSSVKSQISPLLLLSVYSCITVMFGGGVCFVLLVIATIDHQGFPAVCHNQRLVKEGNSNFGINVLGFGDNVL